MRTTIMAAAMAAAAFLSGAGCQVLPEPVRDSARFYVLTPAVEAREERDGAAGWSVGLARVEVPAYLQREAFVARTGESEVRFISDHRWGENLERGIQRVLTENLSRLPGVRRVVSAPFLTEPVDYSLRVRILRFEAGAPSRGGRGTLQMSAAWEVRGLKEDAAGDGSRVVTSGVFQADPVAWERGDYAALAENLSAALAGLSRRLAEALPRAGGE